MSSSPELGAPSVVLRIVVYGAASAGKTTTARALGRGFGEPVRTPVEDDDGTTVWFDFLEYLGGRHEGQPILTQLITVPGHDPVRRLALLDDADVVIFVADTTTDGMTETTQQYVELHEELDRLHSRAAIVIQANKRDHPDAMTLEEFRRTLDLHPDEPVIETVAVRGEGVRQVFVYAVRHGLELVRGDAERATTAVTSPQELLARLESLDPDHPGAAVLRRAGRALGSGDPGEIPAGSSIPASGPTWVGPERRGAEAPGPLGPAQPGAGPVVSPTSDSPPPQEPEDLDALHSWPRVVDRPGTGPGPTRSPAPSRRPASMVPRPPVGSGTPPPRSSSTPGPFPVSPRSGRSDDPAADGGRAADRSSSLLARWWRSLHP